MGVEVYRNGEKSEAECPVGQGLINKVWEVGSSNPDPIIFPHTTLGVVKRNLEHATLK